MNMKIGETRKHNGKKYIAVPAIKLCIGCAFLVNGCKDRKDTLGRCGEAYREDDGIIFVEIKED